MSHPGNLVLPARQRGVLDTITDFASSIPPGSLVGGESYLTFLYFGNSMRGTFSYGDLLLVVPVAHHAVCSGDVIVFRQVEIHGSGVAIVHRVKNRTAAALTTEGDGLSAPDPAPVLAENLVGRVVCVERDGAIRLVLNGPMGQLWAKWIRLRQQLMMAGRSLYHLLRTSRIMYRFWQPDLGQVWLETERGPLVKYIHQRRTVARWWPVQDQFWCKKPYDLIIESPLKNFQHCDDASRSAEN